MEKKEKEQKAPQKLTSEKDLEVISAGRKKITDGES